MRNPCCGEHSSCHTPDPIDQLVAEHGVISAAIDAMAREIDGMRVGGSIRPDFWRRALEFCEQYAERCHDRKEEVVLFPALQTAGLSQAHGVLASLAQQHLQARTALAAIRSALPGGSRDELIRVVDGYVALVCGHIDTENRTLFPLVHELLPTAGMQALRDGFAKFDASPEGGNLAHGRHLAAELEREAGTSVAM